MGENLDCDLLRIFASIQSTQLLQQPCQTSPQVLGGGGGNRTHVLTRAVIGLLVERLSPPYHIIALLGHAVKKKKENLWDATHPKNRHRSYPDFIRL